MRKILLWGPALLFLGIVATAWLGNFGWFAANSASLKFSNQSAAQISEITVTIHATPCLVERLGPGQTALCVLPIASDSHFSITWIEDGEKAYSEQAGYVTPGFDFIYRLDFLGAGKIDFQLEESN